MQIVPRQTKMTNYIQANINLFGFANFKAKLSGIMSSFHYHLD